MASQPAARLPAAAEAPPEWQPLLETVAEEYQMNWRLLAAMAYQESHWNPDARSPTGVL